MKKRNILLFVILILFISPVFCAKPKWLTNLESCYPDSFFIRAIGEGITSKQAEQDAVSSIALTFNSKVKVINTEVREYNSIISETKTSSSKIYILNQESLITSDVEFYCIKFSDIYYDKKEKKYYVVGFVDRKEASVYYRQKIESYISIIKNIIEFSENEKESLYSILNYQKALSLSRIVSSYIDSASVIYPSESLIYDDDINLISQIQSNIAVLKKKNSFYVDVNDSSYSVIGPAISSILEKSGFVYTNINPKYRIIVDIHFSEENYEAGAFVRPDMIIRIINSSGETIDSYSKVYPRYSHQTIQNAYSLALVRIQQDLEENFLKDYR